MKILILLLTITLPTLSKAETTSYCDDTEAAREWNNLVMSNSHSENWQKLHAMWLGFCQKVKDGSIDIDRAIRLFEEERTKSVYREKKRMMVPVSPWG